MIIFLHSGAISSATYHTMTKSTIKRIYLCTTAVKLGLPLLSYLIFLRSVKNNLHHNTSTFFISYGLKRELKRNYRYTWHICTDIRNIITHNINILNINNFKSSNLLQYQFRLENIWLISRFIVKKIESVGGHKSWIF